MALSYVLTRVALCFPERRRVSTHAQGFLYCVRDKYQSLAFRSGLPLLQFVQARQAVRETLQAVTVGDLLDVIVVPRVEQGCSTRALTCALLDTEGDF